MHPKGAIQGQREARVDCQRRFVREAGATPMVQLLRLKSSKSKSSNAAMALSRCLRAASSTTHSADFRQPA